MKTLLKVAALFLSPLLILFAGVSTCLSEEPRKSWSKDQDRAVAYIANFKAYEKQIEYIRDGLRRNRAVRDAKSGRILDIIETELKQQGTRSAPPPKGPLQVEIERSKDGTTTYTVNFPWGIPRESYGGASTEQDLEKVESAIQRSRFVVRELERHAERLGLGPQDWESPAALEALEGEKRRAQSEQIPLLEDMVKDLAVKSDVKEDMVKDLPVKSDVKVDWGEETTRVKREDTTKSQDVSVDWGDETTRVTGEDTKKSQHDNVTRKDEVTYESHQSTTSSTPSNSWSSDGPDTSVNWGEQITRVTGEDTSKSQDVGVVWGADTTREVRQPTRTRYCGFRQRIPQ